jgi:hypothetical protein
MGDKVEVLAFNGPVQNLIVPPTFGCIALFGWKFHNRGGWDGWVFKYEEIHHARCGGTSDFICFATFGHHTSLESSFMLPARLVFSSFSACNLSTVTKCTITGEELDGDPHLPTMSQPPSTVSFGQNLFHFKRLFPFGLSSPEFLLPCVFGQKSKWVRRSLSLEEF